LASEWRSRLAALACAVALAGPVLPARAQVFMTKAQALTWAFPGADRVESETFVLTEDQVRRVEERARARLDSRLVTLYTGVKDGTVLGHALIDVHTVRTLPEAFLVVLGPDGGVLRLRVLAFHEPQEYLPPVRWLAQFEGKDGSAPLRLQRDVHGIAGATLSSQAVTGGVRRALALHEILIRHGG
jgi:Na+-translocating ferredoxin:NAD+ oxidoreductase RnfG subunit